MALPMDLMQRRLSRRAAMATGLASIEALLAACATPAVPVPTPAPPASAYVPAHEGATQTTAGLWQLPGGPVKTVLCGPQDSGTWPLVVYLPGLGEPSDAGERWRVAWASAGYMVLSVQALAEDASAWTSELARNGDFKALGQERFADSATRQRVGALLEVLAQARRNADAGPWRRIDWNRIAVAGFDLGAHTAMAIAGERVAGMDTPLRVRIPAIRAALALSPYAATKAELATRYADIRVPVLGVTGDLDTDPLGLLGDARVRTVPFEHMPGPGKYL
jgi:dienelactone hydrolase